MPCSGDASQSCGAGGRLNLFWSGAEPPPPPTNSPEVGDWNYIGCYTYVLSSSWLRHAKIHAVMALMGQADLYLSVSAFLVPLQSNHAQLPASIVDTSLLVRNTPTSAVSAVLNRTYCNHIDLSFRLWDYTFN